MNNDITIGQVSKQLDIPISTLRYYEQVGLIGPISKNRSGVRTYDKVSLEQINFVKCMRLANIPVDILVKYMKLYKKGEDTLNERIDLLKRQREVIKNQIEELNNVYDTLDFKIKHFEKY